MYCYVIHGQPKLTHTAHPTAPPAGQPAAASVRDITVHAKMSVTDAWRHSDDVIGAEHLFPAYIIRATALNRQFGSNVAH